MVGIEDCGGPNESHEHVVRRRTQAIYTTETIRKQCFMEDLNLFRIRKKKKLVKKFIIEPNWYQVLSENQRKALKLLDSCIYEDIIEGRPIRTKSLLQYIGIHDLPKRDVLMTCVYLGKRDSKVLLAQVFLNTYNHTFDQKRDKYDLKGKTIMSSILYLGLDHIIQMLRERLRPPIKTEESIENIQEPKRPPQRTRQKKIVAKQSSAIVSPYLQKPPPAVMYSVPAKKKFKPQPLPAIEDLEVEPEVEEEVQEEQAPVFIPPPRKTEPAPTLGRRKRGGKIKVSPSMCDEIAGIYRIQPYKSAESILPSRQVKLKKKIGKSGFSTGKPKKSQKRMSKKVTPLKSDRWNKQYLISGIVVIRGQSVYVIGGMIELPPLGDIMTSGGVRIETGEVISIIEGIRAYPIPIEPEKCDCMEKWNTVVFNYLKSHKCTCGHFYDFGHGEEEFPEDITPFFVKPTKYRPYYFNYDHIFELDERRLLVTNEFDRFYRNDSLLNLDAKKKKPKKTKNEGKALKGYLEYLRVALQTLRKYDVAAKLPELYLVPELRAWMRVRVKGPLTRKDKYRITRKSDVLSQLFHKIYTLSFFGHVNPSLKSDFLHPTTWRYAPNVKKSFGKYVHSYRKKMFQVQMDLLNRFWATLYQAEWPDKTFRQIFFSYGIASMGDVLVVNPYDPKAAVERQTIIYSKGYKCPIKGNADAKTM